MSGWIKLYRQLLDKPIWTGSTANQKVVLVTLLLMANHDSKEWEWRGKPYKALPGQLVTSIASIQKATGLTRQNVRTALVRFEKYDFLTIKTTKQNTLITIVNWAFYQVGDAEPNQQAHQRLTNASPTPNQRLTTNKNVKNVKNVYKYNVELKEIVGYVNQKTGKNFRTSTAETKKLVQSRLNDGYTVADFKKVIDNMVANWTGTDYEQYLQPSTLFNGNKFDRYLNQTPVVKKSNTPSGVDFTGDTVPF